MIRALQRHGDSLALVFDKTMLDALNITADSLLQITLHGSAITITPANTGVPQEELEEAIQRLRPKYKTMLENLAK